jgi:hypothetical protein
MHACMHACHAMYPPVDDSFLLMFVSLQAIFHPRLALPCLPGLLCHCRLILSVRFYFHFYLTK